MPHIGLLWASPFDGRSGENLVIQNSEVINNDLYVTSGTGGNLGFAGYSLKAREGSGISQDVLFAASQLLLARDVTRHAFANAFELRGVVGGSTSAGLGLTNASYASPQPTVFMPQLSISIPTVNPGLDIAQSAKIERSRETCRIRNQES